MALTKVSGSFLEKYHAIRQPFFEKQQKKNGNFPLITLCKIMVYEKKPKN
jgi:hypothetical protein